MTSYASSAMPGMVCAPVYECPQERVIHREIMHEVWFYLYLVLNQLYRLFLNQVILKYC